MSNVIPMPKPKRVQYIQELLNSLDKRKNDLGGMLVITLTEDDGLLDCQYVGKLSNLEIIGMIGIASHYTMKDFEEGAWS